MLGNRNIKPEETEKYIFMLFSNDTTLDDQNGGKRKATFEVGIKLKDCLLCIKSITFRE